MTPETDTDGPTQEQMDEAFKAVEMQQEQDEEEKPDPSQLDPITKDEAEYARDADGNLKPKEEAVKYAGEWRRVTYEPFLPGDTLDLEEKFKGRANIDLEELHPILEDKIIEPANVDWEFAKPQVFIPCLMALMQEIQGDADSEFYDEVEDELRKRSDEGEGN